MHEAAIAQSLIEIIQQEMEKVGATKLLTATVVYGRLTNLVPEALDFSFRAMTQGTGLADAEIKMRKTELVVKCICGNEFTPEDDSLLLIPCPKCGEDFGHAVITGKELYLETIEAE